MEKQFEELKWYDGHAVYIRSFSVETLSEDEEAYLVFDGIVYASEVYFNGEEVARHDWGYSPFVCNVTDVLKEENQLFVLVENFLKEDRVPGVRFDWNNDGGIINGVKLVIVPKVHISNFRTETRLAGDKAIIGVDVLLKADDDSVREECVFYTPELHVEVPFSAKANQKITFSVEVSLANIELWSPENPRLYKTEIKTRHETLVDEIGYREIRTDGMKVLLNGKPIRLDGICIHSEFPDTGRTATKEGIELLLNEVMQLGVHFQHIPEVGERVDAVEFATGHRAKNDRSPFSPGFTAGKHPVLAAHRHHSEGPFGQIVIHFKDWVVRIPQ